MVCTVGAALLYDRYAMILIINLRSLDGATRSRRGHDSIAATPSPPRHRRHAIAATHHNLYGLESDAPPVRQSVKCIKCIRWGSNPRLRRDWGLNPTPSWLVVDERPTRPRIQMCRKYFVRDSDRVRTRIDLVRIDPATLAGVDFKSTALTTRPHYRSPIRTQDRCGSRTRDLQISSPSRSWCVAHHAIEQQLRRDSNPQPPDSKSDTLSIAPRS